MLVLPFVYSRSSIHRRMTKIPKGTRKLFSVLHLSVRRTMSQPEFQNIIQIQPRAPRFTGTVIFLHGSGANAQMTRDWVQMMRPEIGFPHLRVLFPTSPARPYTPVDGEVRNVWFDRQAIDPHVPEMLDSINESGQLLTSLIQEEMDAGIPPDRIVIGGFSMGGAMALHVGYRFVPDLAGVFALSSFLNNNSIVYQELKEKKHETLPELFYASGQRDDLVDISWAKTTYNTLLQYGVKGPQFYTLKNAFHELKPIEIRLLYEWINKVLPDHTAPTTEKESSMQDSSSEESSSKKDA